MSGVGDRHVTKRLPAPPFPRPRVESESPFIDWAADCLMPFGAVALLVGGRTLVVLSI